jgi:hypothetical protein
MEIQFETYFLFLSMYRVALLIRMIFIETKNTRFKLVVMTWMDELGVLLKKGS